MNRIFDITLKDLMQILRDRKTFLFLVFMPIAFTLLFGLAFGGSSKVSDNRLPVGLLDQDNGALSANLKSLLSASTVIRLDETPGRVEADLETLVSSGKLAAALVIALVSVTASAAEPEPPLRLSLDVPLLALAALAYVVLAVVLVGAATSLRGRAPERAAEVAA